MLLGSEDVPDCPILRLFGIALIEEMPTRASASTDVNFKTQREV